MDFSNCKDDLFILDSFGVPIHIGDTIQINGYANPFPVVGFGYSKQTEKLLIFSRTEIFEWKDEYQIAKLELLF